MHVATTICNMCSSVCCEIDVQVENGRVVDVRGSKEHPLNHGRICPQGRATRELQYDPLLHYEEPIESHARAAGTADCYPLTLNAGRRVLVYTLSRRRTLSSLRQIERELVAEIHPTSAHQYGVGDGDMMAVESPRGSIALKARMTEGIVSGVVNLVHGRDEANPNVLTDYQNGDPIRGTLMLRASLCKIEKRV